MRKLLAIAFKAGIAGGMALLLIAPLVPRPWIAVAVAFLVLSIGCLAFSLDSILSEYAYYQRVRSVRKTIASHCVGLLASSFMLLMATTFAAMFVGVLITRARF